LHIVQYIQGKEISHLTHLRLSTLTYYQEYILENQYSNAQNIWLTVLL